jgi:predicted NBD/HSP70 family sugar kinase
MTAPAATATAGATTAALFTQVMRRGPLSRSALMKTTGLSSATVTRAVRHLLDAGYLREHTDGPTQPSLGRPANPLSVAASRAHFLGIKITVDEVVGVVTDLCAEVCASRRGLLRDASPEAAVDAISDLVAELLRDTGDRASSVRRLCLAVSGDIDHASGTVRYSPWLDWHDLPLAATVEARVGIPTVIENDVQALTIGQQWFGFGAGVESFVLATIGTGVACGIVIDGHVVQGALGVAGELGHLPIEAGGPVCHCGNQGCVEAICSEGAIAASAAAVTGRPGITHAEALALARDGAHPAAARVFARAGRAIGLALAAVANLVGPERIVLSGEGLAAYDMYEKHMRDAFQSQAFGAVAACELVVRPLPFEEWARGAAALAIRELATTGAFT